MSQQKEKNRAELQNRINRLSVQPSSRGSSLQPPTQSPPRSSSFQPPRRPSRSLRPSQPSTSTDRKTIEKLMESMDRKLDDLLTRQQRLEKQISDLKESLYSRNTDFNAKDKKFVNVIEVLKYFECFCICICINLLFELEIDH